MNTPLVSVLVLTKNCETSIRRCIESLINQDYPNVEIIVQDGKSDDRTLDIINGYNIDHIHVESERDHMGASEGFYKGLKRCSGDIITLCWSDEEIFPHTISWGVNELEQRSDAAAIYGGVFCSDLKGMINTSDSANIRLMSWDFKKALCWEMIPNYVTSFFRKSHLIESGFFERVASYYQEKKVSVGCIMYEYYCLPALKNPIYAVPHFMGKFASHKNQLCSQPYILKELLEQLQNSFNYICSRPDAPEWIEAMHDQAFSGFHLMMVPNLLLFNHFETAYEMFSKAFAFKYNIDFVRSIGTHAVLHLMDGWLYEESKKILGLCIANDPDYAEWYYHIGYASLRLGDYNGAITAFRYTLELSPDHTKAYKNILSVQLKSLFNEPDKRKSIAEIFNFDSNNSLRYHEIVDKLVVLLIHDKRVAHRVETFRDFQIGRAASVLKYLVENISNDKTELLDSCIATRFFAKAYFEEFYFNA